jgi:serine/threonine protein kinase
MSKIFTIADGLQNLGALKTGGQGSVYKGMRMGPIYTAIKLMPTPIYVEDDTDKNYRNFLNEVTKLQKVNEHPSPHVVKFISSGITESGSFPYIEMEYIEGPELGELLLPPHQKVFTLKELLKVAEQLAAALAHCHQVNVKHGDVKSNNVKYNLHTGNYMLLDFGLAIMTEEQRRTSIRHAGAIEFMAPEQHEGKMLLQTDVYSYGIVIYELLAGQVPFPLLGNGETGRNTVMIGHLEKEVPDPLALRRQNLESEGLADPVASELNVPAWLLKVIERCLKKDPADRFADGIALYTAITNGLLLASPQAQVSEQQSAYLQPLANHDLGSDRSQQLERELDSLKPLALKAGITHNEATGRYEQGDYLHVSKTIFLAGASAAILLIAFLSYSLATSSPATVIVPPQKAYVSPFEMYNLQYQQRVKAREDSIRLANEQSAEQAKFESNEKKQNGKKKRKKFLGIF